MHAEVCPEAWVFHSISLSGQTDQTDGASGVASTDKVRFVIEVHSGNIMYAMTRWGHVPGFTACNENELKLSDASSGHVDLCGTHGLDYDTGYVGLYGGRACAVYSITAERVAEGEECSTDVTGVCTTEKH